MWRAIGDAVQGTSHVKMDIPCQDKVYSISTEDGIVAALADGAGSAKLSHFGAERVTRTVCEYLRDNFVRLVNDEDGISVKQELLDVLLKSIDELTDELQCERRELASTLLAIAIKEDEFILVHLGDGVIGYLRGRDLKVASTPDNGEFVNETVFTTSINAISSIQLKKGKLGEIMGFILMSDGPEVSLYNKKEKCLVDGIKNVMLSCSLLDENEAKQSISESLEETLKKRTVDDCSLMIIIDTERVIDQLLKDEAYKKRVCGIKNNNSSNTRSRLKFYDDLFEYISEPKNIDQISKHFHIDKKVVKRRMVRLEQYGLIQKIDGKYSGTIPF